MICHCYRFSFHLEVEDTSHELLVNFQRKKFSTVNSKGNSIQKMVPASKNNNLKLVSASSSYQFWSWCLPAINKNFEIGVKQPSISILKMVLASNLYQFEIGVIQQSITFLKLVSNSHQYQFWNWCLPAIKQFWNWCQTAININFEIGVRQPSITILKLVSASHQYQFWNWCLPAVTHFHFRLHIWHMCFKHILHVFVICNEITYDLSLLHVQFSSRSGRYMIVQQ